MSATLSSGNEEFIKAINPIGLRRIGMVAKNKSVKLQQWVTLSHLHE